mgnify:FL=1
MPDAVSAERETAPAFLPLCLIGGVVTFITLLPFLGMFAFLWTVVGAIAAALIFIYMFRGENYSRTVLIIYAIVVVLMVTGSRASFRVISDALQRRRQTGRRIVVYGAGDGGARRR